MNSLLLLVLFLLLYNAVVVTISLVVNRTAILPAQIGDNDSGRVVPSSSSSRKHTLIDE
jgi:hypothetical protein